MLPELNAVALLAVIQIFTLIFATVQQKNHSIYFTPSVSKQCHASKDKTCLCCCRRYRRRRRRCINMSTLAMAPQRAAVSAPSSSFFFRFFFFSPIHLLNAFSLRFFSLV